MLLWTAGHRVSLQVWLCLLKKVQLARPGTLQRVQEATPGNVTRFTVVVFKSWRNDSPSTRVRDDGRVPVMMQ